ncbi:MAG: hypothetical protein CMH97_02895 [Oceanospirillaceae bacterium]|uniref:hypothetical protein n=1 Tax=Thalassolituus sp. UBA3500 TaxID=1947664 RepID=UPI000C101E58|nr:hypothetical protein [Thalassolituus sp. UBA3500]MAE34199.1 hypothetical protein [Oceanospirillaceae bacterium]MBN58147.1 hypothetical protein [Oceanospirillaceae bacterium]|tara:strand:+ start:8214 stop:9221 length:1008 start_codon:yes stop_codon:yes gene_type:complete
MKTLAVPFIALTLAIGGCASMGGGEAEEKKIEVVTDNLEKMEDSKEVYLGQFSVTFVVKDKASATSQSSMFSKDRAYAKAILKSELLGVPEETMQAITDEAYKSFVSKLKAQGYTIRNYSDLTSSKAWSGMDKLETPYQPSAVGSFFKGDQGKTLTFTPAGTDLLVYKGYPSAPNPVAPYKLAELAGDLGYPILTANYRVHFANLSGQTDRSMDYNTGKRTYSAEVSLGQAINVQPTSGITFVKGVSSTFSNKAGYAQLETPVIIGGAFGETEDTTSGAQKAANAFSSLLGMVSGGSSDVTEVTVNADPVVYARGVAQAIDLTNDEVLKAFVAGE